MRRLAALALAIGLAGLAVARVGSGEHAGSAALALGVALLAASIVGWLFEFLRLPRVTGYLIFGLLCGPSMANLITPPMARELGAANGLAIAIIAFLAGLQLNARRLAPRLRAIGWTGGATVAAVWLGAAGAFVACWPLLPIAPALAGLQRAAAAAIAATLLAGFGPAVATAVIAEGRARGPLADTVLAISVLSEAGVIVLSAPMLEFAHVAFGSGAGGVALAASMAWQLVGSLAFGAALGALFAMYLRYIGREVTLVFLALCIVLIAVDMKLHFDPFLSGLAAGLVVQNVLDDTGDVLRDAIEHGAMPVFVLFFAAAGASMHVEALSVIGVFALVVGLWRALLVFAGARLGARLAGDGSPTAPLVWRGLMTTADVAITFAAVVSAEFLDWGPRLETLVLAVFALFALVGPILLRAALAERKEIGRATGGLIVVSNREPWMHVFANDGSIAVRPTPGGVSVALDALMRERGGVWIAHGAGSADRAVVDDRDSVAVPPDAPAYRLRRLWLSPKEEERYYAGFANSALWPLCHQAHVKPIFRAEDWDAYQRVNRRFADIAAVEAPPDSSVFLNDYHLSLAAQYLRRRRPFLRTALFWHIPWPDTDRLRICPWRKEIVAGLLHNDLIAFQLPRDQRNFLQAVSEEIGASVAGETVYFGSRQVRVVAIPIGADFDRISEILADPSLPETMHRIECTRGLTDKFVGVGVDRLDYTKGIPERIAAIERALEERPAWADRFAFVQIGVPSRGEVPAYAQISAEIAAQIARVNTRFGRGKDDGPIRYVTESFALPELVALYRLADFCIVSSLHDGMNLVAKEFVAARDDLDGVLILSELAGASQELAEALIINPYDERGFTAAILRAADMPDWERRRRMQALRRRVAGRDVLAWASDILDRLERRKGSSFLAG